eukprot:gene15041-17793_t
MSEAEGSKNRLSVSSTSSSPTQTRREINQIDGANQGGQSSGKYNNNTSPQNERRKSRAISRHSDFDYLETLLSDMSVSDESIRKSIIDDNQNPRIKSLRLTSNFDLESTLKDLEAFYKDNTLQSKRKQSAHLQRVASNRISTIAAPSTSTPAAAPMATQKITDQSTFAPVAAVQQPPQQQQQQFQSLTSSQKRGSPDKVSAIAREAIDAADLLDQMIESFGSVASTPSDGSPNSTLRHMPVITSGTGTIRPASKLNSPVDIATASPKPPTPIATLSALPLSPMSMSQNSDKMLDEMITLFKESNSNLKFAGHGSNVTAKPQYLSQQHYTLTPDEIQHLSSKQRQQSVDEDLVQRILCDNEIDESSMLASVKPLTEKPWYIKQEIDTKETIGFGNHGLSARAGIYKEKRIIGKSWTFITPQATPLLFNEIEQLIAIKHPNVLSLIGSSFTTTFNTFSEYITGNNLDMIMKNVDEKNELAFIIRISEEIASAMSFLHSFNIVHRSLHPKNILLNSDLKVYIKDYGFASLKDDTIRKKLMTPSRNQLQHTQYMAPELFNVLVGGNGGYDTKIDVFSFGVLLWEMFGRDIKPSDLKSHVVSGYTHYVRPSLPNCPFTIDKLIRLCTSSDPSIRPTFQTILKVLRQPLHTLQRFSKPEAPIGAAAQTQHHISNPSSAFTLDASKKEKIGKIFAICQDLVATPTLANFTKASFTLETICKNTENYPYLLQLELLPVLFEMLHTRFEDIQLSSIRCLSLLLQNDEMSELFRNMLGINTLIQLLTLKSENILFSTIRLLQHICHKDVNVVEVLSKGGIPILIQLLSHPNEMIRLQVVWCITMILESPSAQDELIKMGGVEILLEMFVTSQNDGFILRIASALSRVLPLKYSQELINNGPSRQQVIEKYTGLLDSSFETLRMLGLEALAMLVSNKDNQEYIIQEDVIPLLIEYLDIGRVSIAPQMTAIKVILVLSSVPKHITYLKTKNIVDPLQKLKSSSPHPSIQKASEKILALFV